MKLGPPFPLPAPRVFGLLLAALAVLLLAATPLLGQQAAPPLEEVRHVVSRVSYGPRPGDIERVRGMGIQAYIEEQLHPERLADADLQARLAGYRTLAMDFEALRDYDAPVARIAIRRRSSALERGMEPSTSEAAMNGGGARARMRAQVLNPRIAGRVDQVGRGRENEETRWGEVRLLRAIHSERQLFELMVDFWMNHFSIQFGDSYLLTDFEENVVRPRALGSFHDLLVATAQHPAMLIYLDNWLSSAPEEEVKAALQRKPGSLVAGALDVRARGAFLEQAKGLNENYAREVMELHTLGVDGGYTQQDVIEVARALTGWTITGWSDRQDGPFLFDPALHVTGDKTVLGQRIPSGGMDEGLRILDVLAHHPSTARFVSTKLVRRFVADEPPAEVVDAAARTFMETKGDIRAVLRTILTSPGFFSEEVREGKVKKPLEMVASALRAVDADVDTRFDANAAQGGSAMQRLNQALTRMGERLYRREAPDGWPDVASAWVSTNALFQRLRFSMDLARGQIGGVRVNLDAAEALFEELGYREVSAEQVAQAKRLMADASRADAGAGGGMMAEETMAEEMTPGGEPAMESPETGAYDPYSMQIVDVADETAELNELDELRAIAVALLLGSPDFQKR